MTKSTVFLCIVYLSVLFCYLSWMSWLKSFKSVILALLKNMYIILPHKWWSIPYKEKFEMRLGVTFISGKGQRKGDSSQFIWLKSLFLIAFIRALMYLACLHQFVERFKNIKWKKLFHDFVGKPCVDFLKVYEVCISFLSFFKCC